SAGFHLKQLNLSVYFFSYWLVFAQPPDDSKEERLELEQITTHGVKNRKEEICSNTKQAKIVLCRSSVIV
ncbi:hypothetical protein, partial [Streptococcus suis]|uniref:hypothetical protein n=1 Tax=Streptococcus suis TaxID=1307 RepID=UPI0038BADA44